MENFNLEKKLSSPEEEIVHLKEQIDKKAELEPNFESSEKKDKIIQSVIDEYARKAPEQILQKGTYIPEKFRQEIILELKPETHDMKMAELISISYEKGISNTLDILYKLDDPHLTDDFHRFLVQYLKSGYGLVGLKEQSSLQKSLSRTLFEVTLSYDRQKEESIKNFIGLMEEFYRGMTSVVSVDKNEYLSIEITNSIGSREFIFYISVPDYKAELLEKQLLSVFPHASLFEMKDDFNVFLSGGYSTGAYVENSDVIGKVIRTYDRFENDPIQIILNTFSKLNEQDEAACIQLIFKPIGVFYNKNLSKSLHKIEKGEKKPEELYVRNTIGSKINYSISKILGTSLSGSKNSSENSDNKDIDSELMENLKLKIETPIISTNIRLITTAKNSQRAEAIMHDVKSSFNQFENTTGNKFKFYDIKNRNSKEFFRQFTFREFNDGHDLPLNLSEIATVIHFPANFGSSSPELKTNKMKTSSAPITISNDGIYLGKNFHRNTETEIYFSPEDRLRHFYTIGQTGTGKTNFMKTMIIQDIQNGEGVCMIDPHGSDIQDVLANVPPERYEDVIYFDPGYAPRPMALNMLEYDRNKPEQKTFVVNELFGIFQKLYGANPESMGPMFEQYFRNATMLVIDDPDSGSTLLEISRVMSDRRFRELKLSRCKNPVVVQFWREIATKAGGEASLENIVPYITSKFDVFLANDIMRPVIAQETSSFNFRKIMDERKILLVNLSKGTLGDINSNLIGLILVGKILMASLSRSDSDPKTLPPFYLYIDEFQNITTNSIATILSEARKYKLSLNIAHQFVAQLDEKIKDAVFGNVGSMAVFRVGSDDAEFLERQMSPVFSAKDIMNIDNFNAYLKMLYKGVPIDPFSLRVPPAPEGNRSKLEDLKQLSYLKYGKERNAVEEEIMNKYNKPDYTKTSFS